MTPPIQMRSINLSIWSFTHYFFTLSSLHACTLFVYRHNRIDSKLQTLKSLSHVLCWLFHCFISPLSYQALRAIADFADRTTRLSKRLACAWEINTSEGNIKNDKECCPHTIFGYILCFATVQRVY